MLEVEAVGRLATSLVGAGLGFAIGGPTGARIGFTAGSVIGNAVFSERGDNDNRAQPQLAEFQPLNGNAGAYVDLGYGSNRHSGNIIWLGPVQTIEGTPGSSGGGGGKGGPGGDGGGGTEGTPPRRIATFAVLWKAVASGQSVSAISRIWANGNLIADPRAGLEVEAYIASDRLVIHSGLAASNSGVGVGVRHYLGTLDQLPDPAYQAVVGVDNAPAFRGWVYSVFEDFDLAPYGNQMPYSLEAEVVTGTVTPPPIRIRQFSTPLSDNQFRGATYNGNQTWSHSSFYGSDEFGNPVVSDHIYVTHQVFTYNLFGKRIDAQQVTKRSNYVDVGILIEADPFNVRNAPFLGYTKMAAGQNANSSASSWWSFYRGQSGSNNSTISAPSGAHPYSARDFLNDQPVDYTGALEAGNNSALYIDNHVYAYNSGAGNQPGIARYNVTQPLWIAEGDAEDFFDLRALGYLTVGAAETGRAEIYQGDDGYLYIVAKGGPSARFDNGVNVIQVTKDLQHVQDIDLGAPHSNSAELYAWGGMMVLSSEQTNDDSRTLSLYDISSPGSPSLISNTDTGTPLGSASLVALGNGLFAMPDGIWSLRETVASDTVTLESIVESLCDERGLEVADYNADNLDQTVRGFKISTPSSGRGAIESLEKGFSFDGFESGGVLTFKKRGGASVVTVPEDDLGADSNQGESTDFIRVHGQELELPKQVDFGFSDWDQDYQPDWQYSAIIDTVSENIERISVPIVMTSTEGAQRVDQIKRQRWTERNSISLSLGPKYSYLDPADVITVQTPQGNFNYRILSIERGANMVHRLQLVAEEVQNYSSTAVGNDADQANAQSLSTPGPTKVSIIDTVPLRDQDTGDGYYITASGFLAAWDGAFILSTDGTTETLITQIYNESTCGFAENALADADEGIDYVNTVTVQLVGDGTLASTDLNGFLSGDNVAILGDEIIFFKDVTDNGGGNYTIRNIYRGWLTTPSTGHAANDRFVMLTETTVFNVDFAASNEGATLRLLGRSIYEHNATPIEFQATFENQRAKAVPPQLGYAVRRSNGDYRIWISGGVRVDGALVNQRGPKEDFTTEAYEIVPYTAADVALGAPRVLSVTFDPWHATNEFDGRKYATYTFADQQTDNSGSGVDNAKFYCYKLDEGSERSRPLIINSSKSFTIVGSHDGVLTSMAPRPIWFWPWEEDRKQFFDASIGAADNSPSNGGTYVTDSPVQGGTGCRERTTAVDSAMGRTSASGASGTINAASLDEMSVSFWCKYPSIATSSTLAFISQWSFTGGSAGNGRFRVNTVTGSGNSGRLEIQARFDSAQVGPVLQAVKTDLNDNAWHFVVANFSAKTGFDKQEIWIDGALDSSQGLSANGITLDSAIEPSGGQLVNILERNPSGASLTGRFGRFAWWDRVLTQSEIETLWALRNF